MSQTNIEFEISVRPEIWKILVESLIVRKAAILGMKSQNFQSWNYNDCIKR